MSLPATISTRRAAALSGFAHSTIANMTRGPMPALRSTGASRSIPLADLEQVLGRRFTEQDYDNATIALERRRRARELEPA